MLENKKMMLFRLSLPILFAAAYILVLLYFYNERQQVLQEYAETLERDYTIIIDEYTNMADLVFHSFINNREILSILAEARDISSQAQKNILRRKLLYLISPIYSELRNHNFRQLHFHEPDNRSFLRAHKPDKYGDDLTGIRESVEHVNRTGIKISGFEEGRIFNGYRNVYPLTLENSHLGSVELSISMSAVINRLWESFGVSSQFILLRSVVNEKVFSSEQSNYREWPVDPSFVLDANISAEDLLSDHISEWGIRRIRETLSAGSSENKPFSRELRFDGRDMIINFLPILNFSNKTVAFILAIEDNKKLAQLRSAFAISSAAFLLLMAVALSFLFYSLKVNRQIEKMIIYDPLTKAFSRREILSRLESEHYRYLRYGSVFTICMMDIDHFKVINDNYGHLSGDKVLFELSAFILSRIRNSDQFGRFGGEEFLLILPKTEGEQAFSFVDSLREEIENHEFSVPGQITVSIGLSTVGKKDHETNQIIKRADEKLYQAKRSGRNKVC